MVGADRSVTYRLYPTAQQQAALVELLEGQRELYNAALEERSMAWTRCRVQVSLHDQVNQLPYMRDDVPALKRFGTRVAIGTLMRLDEAFAGFFRRVRAGVKPGYPRFRGPGRWDSVQWSNTHTWDLIKTGKGTYGRLRVMGVGHVKVRLHRWYDEAAPAKLVVRRRGRRWEATISWRGVKIPRLEPTGSAAGMDLGIAVLAAVVDESGEVTMVDNPRALKRALDQLAKAHKARAACRITGRRNGKGRRARANDRAAALHRRAANIRRHHAHKASVAIVRAHDLIAIEKLRIPQMTRSAKGTVEAPGVNVKAKAGLNRAILDAGWGQLVRMITYKAEGAGRTIVLVNAPHTSQTCARCGRTEPASRADRDHFVCVECGHAAHADVNAAEVILAVAIGRLTIDGPRRQRPKRSRPGSGHRDAA